MTTTQELLIEYRDLSVEVIELDRKLRAARGARAAIKRTLNRRGVIVYADPERAQFATQCDKHLAAMEGQALHEQPLVHKYQEPIHKHRG
jgi:hypothetical protein